MTFLVYRRTSRVLRPNLPYPPGENFRLAGYNLIYKAWQRHGRPLDVGWHTTADELIKLHTNDTESAATRALLIDFHPKAQRRIAIIEILDIYVYTYSDGQKEPIWSPMMLRLRNIFYKEYDNDVSQDKKVKILTKLPHPQNNEGFVEFLYLNGPWGFGRNGMTNAAFIHKPARDYFKQFF